MPHKIRTALLGYGLAGSVFHASALSALADFSVEVIVTSNPLRQAAARAAFPGARVMNRGAWEAFGSHASIDLVVVATPPVSHAVLARRALAAGCAVVVDKPFTCSSAEGEELIAFAAERSLILTPYQNRRWDGEFLTVQKLLAEGALGTVHRFESRLERWQPHISKPWKAEATAAQGGGVLFDLGSHAIDQALVLFGPVESVYGELSARRAEERADDDVFVALRHCNGVISHLGLNLNAAQKGPRMRVLGSRAGYLKQTADVQEAQLKAGIFPGDLAYGVDPQEAWGTVGVEGEQMTIPTERGNFPGFYELLAAAMLDGGPVPVDPYDSVAGLRIMEQLREQSAA